MPDALAVPDLWQLETLRRLRAGEDVVLQAPTGAGKTLVFERLVEAGVRGQAVFAVPTRALANDKRAEWAGRGWDVGIATGDVAENTRARVLVATLETQRARFLEGDAPALLAVDEYQMLADEERGPAYETVLALAPPSTQLLLLSGSVGNPESVAGWLQGLGRKVACVVEHRRPVPLEEINLDAVDAPGGDSRNPTVRALIRGIRGDLGPILVFAPRRRATIALAEELAHALPPDGGPRLTPEQRAVAGDDLARLIRRGVGLHHSGLTYRQRSEVVEPLAKSGALPVVVATTGLAAGINFSLRSVLVTDREYVAGHRVREVRSDELLQMFGRAGRRGLDDRGHALRTGDSPRLAEARPLQLHRAGGLDWTAFLRRMTGAADPVEAAESLAARLFSRDPVDLALRDLPETPAEETPAARGPVRLVRELQGRDGTWQRPRPTTQVPMAEALLRVGDTWHPALEKPDSLKGLAYGTPCRLTLADGAVRHGRRVPLARFVAGADTLEPMPWLRKALALPENRRHRPERWTLEALEQRVLPALPLLTQGGVVHGPPETKGDTLLVRLDYARALVRVHPDAGGNPLVNPRFREEAREDIRLADALGGGVGKGGRDGRLWHRLGLVDRAARPTRRGEVASLFQHGEGLAVAVALEDTGYGAEALAWDLAELRAGERLSLAARSSSRLAAGCRLAFRSLTAPGYLREGLPEGFGEGTAEILRSYAQHGKTPQVAEADAPSRGDLERALMEWRSVLRLVAHGPGHPWERWQELRDAARRVLGLVGG